MNSLSAIDSMFLYSETGRSPMNVLGVLVIGSGADGPPGFERIARRVAERLPRLALFRRRLVEAPLGLTHPVWIEDPDFDLHEHLHRISAPAPGGERELAEVVALLARGRLDRSRPLWQIWAIEGLVTKMRFQMRYPASEKEKIFDHFSQTIPAGYQGRAPCGKTRAGFDCLLLKDEVLSARRKRDFYRHFSARVFADRIEIYYEISMDTKGYGRQ